jgi:hypothetical protein
LKGVSDKDAGYYRTTKAQSKALAMKGGRSWKRGKEKNIRLKKELKRMKCKSSKE